MFACWLGDHVSHLYRYSSSDGLIATVFDHYSHRHMLYVLQMLKQSHCSIWNDSVGSRRNKWMVISLLLIRMMTRVKRRQRDEISNESVCEMWKFIEKNFSCPQYKVISPAVSPEGAASTRCWTCWPRSRKATSEGSKFTSTDFRFVEQMQI